MVDLQGQLETIKSDVLNRFETILDLLLAINELLFSPSFMPLNEFHLGSVEIVS